MTTYYTVHLPDMAHREDNHDIVKRTLRAVALCHQMCSKYFCSIDKFYHENTVIVCQFISAGVILMYSSSSSTIFNKGR